MLHNLFLKTNWVPFLLALFASVHVQAQLPSNKIKPGTMYHAGDTVRSPRLGMTVVVPPNWQGVLPRDTEVFLMMPTDNTIAEVYAVVNERTDLVAQEKKWMGGFPLADALVLKPDGPVTQRAPGILSANAKLVGANANTNQGKFYAEAKCSPTGFCVVWVLSASPGIFEGAKKTLQTMVDNIAFTSPSSESPYKNFNWQEFLGGKLLLNFGYDQSSKREDEVDLCTDGTFTSRITRTGIFSDQAKGYKGKKKGTWAVKSNGDKATITLSFAKLEPVEFEIQAKDEEVYINGKRYFVGESENCQQ